MPFMPLVTGAGASDIEGDFLRGAANRQVADQLERAARARLDALRLEGRSLGYFAMSKNSGPRRSLSRFAFCVVMP